MEIRNFCVAQDEAGLRLDVFLSQRIEDMSRSYVQKLIKQGKARVEGKEEKARYAVEEYENIQIEIPAPKNLEVKPQNIEIDIVHEDDDIIIVNKPQGMVVHPAPGNYEGTLVNALMHHCKGNLSSINGVVRPGIVHRIDKDTSGLLVVAKNNNAHNSLSDQFKDHSIERTYEMICVGSVKQDDFTIDLPIARNPSNRLKMAVVKGGKNAITHFHVIKRFDGYTHLKANLETGRTHQIRVHMASRNTPLLGDPVYGVKKCKFNLSGQMLHARTLGFEHPRSGCHVQFESELPERFKNIMKVLEIKSNI